MGRLPLCTKQISLLNLRCLLFIITSCLMALKDLGIIWRHSTGKNHLSGTWGNVTFFNMIIKLSCTTPHIILSLFRRLTCMYFVAPITGYIILKISLVLIISRIRSVIINMKTSWMIALSCQQVDVSSWIDSCALHNSSFPFNGKSRSCLLPFVPYL